MKFVAVLIALVSANVHAQVRDMADGSLGKGFGLPLMAFGAKSPQPTKFPAQTPTSLVVKQGID